MSLTPHPIFQLIGPYILSLPAASHIRAFDLAVSMKAHNSILAMIQLHLNYSWPSLWKFYTQEEDLPGELRRTLVSELTAVERYQMYEGYPI